MVEEVYKRNREKKWLKCLKCGKPMWTSPVHRICRRCTKRNYEVTPVNKYALLQGREFRGAEFD